MAIEGHPVQWVTIALGSCDGSLLNSQPKAPRSGGKMTVEGQSVAHTHIHTDHVVAATICVPQAKYSVKNLSSLMKKPSSLRKKFKMFLYV